MSNSISDASNQRPKTFCTTTNITPYQPEPPKKQFTIPPTRTNPRIENSILIGSVNGVEVGEGAGKLYSSVNGRDHINANQVGPPNDAQMRKLVYNMYRGLLNTKHERANNIIESAPKGNITTDEGVNDRVVSMMRQQKDIAEIKMNYGPPPPPPPPPFATGAPPVRLPSEIAAAAAAARLPAPPMMGAVNLPAPPMALAGAMMKDKKPFTYTPGGLNLSEINAQHQPTLSYQVQRGNANIDPVMQSKSFRVLQNAYDNNYHAEGPIQEQTPVEPKKYTGASIPSRSFRMLQAMTDTEDVLQSPEDGKPGEKSSEKTTALSSSNTPLCSSPSELQEETGNVASYTCTKDSPVYRHVTPKLANNGVKEDRVVNAALSSRRANSPRLWKNIAQASSRNISPSGSSTSISSQSGAESPRLTVPIVKRNDSSESLDSHLLYDGSKIPSRVFKQLQNDYSNEPQAHKSGSSSPTTSRIITEVHLPRIFNQMNIEPPTSSNDDDARSFSSSSNFDYEDACRNGVYETAAVKESVLKELTSQFDPQTKLKKPRAAPGRVFRYLQEQYGEDIDVKSSPSGRSTGNNSPNILSSTSTDSGHYEMEPKPYDGGRIPGRTFRMLQENYESHPSVLQARK